MTEDIDARRDAVLEAVHSDTPACAICLTGSPAWTIPTDPKKPQPTRDRLARQAGATAKHTEELFICTPCLVLVEDKDTVRLTQTTLDALMKLQKPTFAGMTKMQRKKMQMNTHILVSQSVRELLSTIAGEPQRIPDTPIS